MARQATGQVLERKTSRGLVFALRFRAYGERRYVTLGTVEDGWTRARADEELERVLAGVKLGTWEPPRTAPEPSPAATAPTFHEFASEWLADRRPELRKRTAEDYEWAL